MSNTHTTYTERETEMSTTFAFATEEAQTRQQVLEAVYCWVLVNEPEVIEEARELVSA